MKRGGTEHPKVGRLARVLSIEGYAAVGLLECLFHWTAKYAPAGDIGRWGAAEIARGIGWVGDPERLISALRESGWIDEHTECTFCVHDWSHHADDGVHMALARARKRFADGSVPKMSRMSRDERGPLEQFFNPCTQEAHAVYTPCTPPSPPLPSPPLPSPPSTTATTVRAQSPNRKPDADAAVVGSVEWVGDQRQAYERLLAKPTWLPDGETWIDPVTCRRLARLPTTSLALIDWWLSEARKNRKTLKTPAGFVIKNIRDADPDLLTALSVHAQTRTVSEIHERATQNGVTP